MTNIYNLNTHCSPVDLSLPIIAKGYVYTSSLLCNFEENTAANPFFMARISLSSGGWYTLRISPLCVISNENLKHITHSNVVLKFWNFCILIYNKKWLNWTATEK